MPLPQMQYIFFVTAWHNARAYTRDGKQGDEPEVSASQPYAGGTSGGGGQEVGAQEHDGTASCAVNNDRLYLGQQYKSAIGLSRNASAKRIHSCRNVLYL